MKILIYAPLAVLGHHFETDLEIAQNHLSQGDEVYFIRCSSNLKDLRFMACQGILRCDLCQSRCRDGISRLTSTEKLKVIDLGPLPSIKLASDIDPTSLEQVKAYRYRESDIGSAYISSLISDTRNPSPDLKAYRELTLTNLEKLQGLIEVLSAKLDEIKPDLVYFFNGRFNLYRPLLRLCQQRKIDFFVHERGSDNSKYSLTRNNMPHDIETKLREMSDCWESISDSSDREKKASQWYENRARGMMGAWRSFTKSQQENLLPDGWDQSKRNIVFFISSEDEFCSVPGWELEMFSSQAEAVRTICSSFSSGDFRLYVRMHPNLRGLKNAMIRDFDEIGKSFDHCSVIGPDDPVNSYSLLRNSEKVIVFGSTVGVEATYWGIPSILIGKSYYGAIGAAHTPSTRKELLELINEKNLPAKQKETALRYGLWASTFGIPFSHYKPINLTTGKFNDVMISGNRFYTLVNYTFITLRDVVKVAKGEYSLWHLTGKIQYKLALFRSK